MTCRLATPEESRQGSRRRAAVVAAGPGPRTRPEA